MKRNIISTIFICLTIISTGLSQDTFSIVAVDPVTGEVGSAGASCVDLFQTFISSDDFLGVLIPNVGAINTQAYYIPENQDNATDRLVLGEAPSEIIPWLIANDVTGEPEYRQYGIAAFVNDSPEVAAHTGSSTDDYKNHVLGLNYSIQGNILLGQQVLDSMEARFLNENGDLACKLMAALQGANMVGADTRCATNGTSSLFAFVKVAQPTDQFGDPSFLTSVRTADGAGIEPIDSLQIKFDLIHACDGLEIREFAELDRTFQVFPNPTDEQISLKYSSGSKTVFNYSILQSDGRIVLSGTTTDQLPINVSSLLPGPYIVRINDHGLILSERIIIQ